ncbi:HAMP domain-containing protein [Acidipila sp. 4G-K13]|uniref:histidine kinase n=2 Tax=Paracidobacterium acidisoli TaxID=2303751 RepID=A0A372IPH7_9BACT|nr:HAMP domain-containing protein [Paracidobacterium acidisoli]
MFLLLFVLAALNAFNLRFLHPRSTGQILIFTSLSVVVFLLLITVMVLLSRNTLRLLAEQRSHVLGSRLRTRMFMGAVLLSFVPAFFMFLFSFLLMNRSIDRWFSQPVAELREDTSRLAMELSHYAALNARAEAESFARSPEFTQSYETGNTQALLDDIRAHRITLQGGFTVLYRDNAAVAQYELPPASGAVVVSSWIDSDAQAQPEPSGGPLTATVLSASQRTDEPVLSVGGREFALGSASLAGGGTIIVGLPMPSGLSSVIRQVRVGASEYWMLYRERRTIRTTYFLLLLLLTVLVFFASSWLALYLSKQITRPVEALADAMNEIAQGHYDQRITVTATGEMAELTVSFNHMAADLEQSRRLADTSTRELSQANLALQARRNELETILETIPTGVVTLDGERRILGTNRTFADLLGLDLQRDLSGVPLDSLLPLEMTEELQRLDRRAHRMGVAASEFEMRTTRGRLSISATMAALDLGESRRGSILVIEDVTEFLRAQRQVAWKEVAQRVAHEIRNPLTPIGLSAERIRRHIDRNLPESPAVIRKCCDVILGSVESMRTLVDQFAALAEFPAAQPRPAALNAIVESAVSLFHGRIENIRIEQHLTADLPPVMADPEALKRALANLIDNAAEAMQDSLLRVLSIETCLSEHRGIAEIVVADTGPGLTDEMRERIFLPWVSTRQRGTGLGLAIAAKIVQDHGGAIRAERNAPAGARFIIELPLAENPNGNGNGHGSGKTAAALTSSGAILS